MQTTRITGGAVALAVALFGATAGAQESQLAGMKSLARSAPQDASAAIAYGRTLRRAGHLAEASTELTRAQSLAAQGPNAIAARFELARVELESDKHDVALMRCRGIAKLQGADSASHACLAETHLQWRRASEAEVDAQAALAGGAQNLDAKIALGIALELMMKEDAAEAALREAVAWAPNDARAHAYLGRLLVRRLKRDEGVTELRKALTLDPDGPDTNYELALTMPPNAEAAALLEKAVKEKPTFVAALRRLADVYLDLKKMPEARAAAEGALKSNPNDEGAHLIMGKVFMADNKPDDALKEGQAALGIMSNSAHAKLLVADAYAMKKEIDLAVEAYQAAFGFDHTSPTPLVHASVACHDAGRDTSAKAFGEKATKEFPDWAPGWVALGDALVGNKEIPAAKAAYEAALKARGPLDGNGVRAKIAALK